jgi:hypothetical protein
MFPGLCFIVIVGYVSRVMFYCQQENITRETYPTITIKNYPGNVSYNDNKTLPGKRILQLQENITRETYPTMTIKHNPGNVSYNYSKTLIRFPGYVLL